MSKLSVGLAAGVAIAVAAAVPALASDSSGIVLSSGTATRQPVQAAAVTTTTKAAVTTTRASATTVTKVVAPAVKTVRSIQLSLPTLRNQVGTNVAGYIRVVDTQGKTVTGVAGVAVALEQLRGTKWVEIAGGPTDENGMYAVAFTSTTNMTLRAVFKPATGKPTYGKSVVTTAVARVTWAARPVFEATKKVRRRTASACSRRRAPPCSRSPTRRPPRSGTRRRASPCP
jgi:hypothetical protein